MKQLRLLLVPVAVVATGGAILLLSMFGFWADVSDPIRINGIDISVLISPSAIITLALVSVSIAMLAENVSAARQPPPRAPAETPSARAMGEHCLTCVIDPSGMVIDNNRRFRAVLGHPSMVSLSHLLPKGPAIQIDQEGPNEFRVALQRGKEWEGEHEFLDASGNKVALHSTLMPQHGIDGAVSSVIVVSSDISHIRTRAALDALADLYAHARAEVYAYDTDNLQLIFANATALRALDKSKEELLDKPMHQVWEYFDPTTHKRHIKPILDKPDSDIHLDLPMSNRAVEIRTRMVQPEGAPAFFVSVIVDTSKRHELERAKTETVSVISHELRTPLTSIRGGLKLLKSVATGYLDSNAMNLIDIAERNSERLLLVVNDILDFEKMQAGKMNFDMKSMDLGRLVSDSVEMNAGYGDEHGVRFAAVGIDQPAFIDGNADRLMQVMSNLMSNAAKFSPEGGVVTVHLKDLGENWRVAVQDEGPGIPESARASLFQSFAQVEPTDGRKRKGTGLGLAISKKIVDAHKGKISFDSRVGEGTTFYYDIPKAGQNVHNIRPLNRNVAAE